MKKLSISASAVYLLLVFVFQSCKKDANLSQASTASSGSQSSQIKTLDLRPGLEDGQDAYILYKKDEPYRANQNFNHIAELTPAVWTASFRPFTQRVLIKFTGLSAIPSNATILSAKLYLYGLSSSQTIAVGNSYYPDSIRPDYYYKNRCLVTLLKSDWEESTVTWNTQPESAPDIISTFGPTDSQWEWDAEVDVKHHVQLQVSRPNQNFGFGIRLHHEKQYRSVVFGSSEAPNENDRPRLVVEYTE